MDTVINLNDIVEFVLSDEGRRILDKFDEDVKIGMAKYGMNNKTKRNIGPNGEYSMQLWHFMEVFGRHLSLVKPVPTVGNIITFKKSI